MTRRFHRETMSSLALFCYVAAGVLCAVLVVNSLRVPTGWTTDRYSAEFTDVGGLTSGSEVTITGVRVGRVTDVEIHTGDDGRSAALVEFEIDHAFRLPRGVRASVRYGDMLGVRFLALDPTADGRPVTGGTDPLPTGARIPLADTTGPVDLTALVNGFKPLFDAIDPVQVDALSGTIVDAFQGTPGAMDTLLARLAEASRDVVSRQDVYRRLTDNVVALNGVLVDRQDDLEAILTGLDQVSTALAAEDGSRLDRLLSRADSTVSTVEVLLRQNDPALRGLVGDGRATTDGWIPHTPAFEEALGNAPRFAAAVNRMSDHGSFLNLYMCNFTVTGGDFETSLFGYQNSEICR